VVLSESNGLGCIKSDTEQASIEEQDEEEDVEYDSDEESVASGIFLWAAPVKHSDLHFDDNCSPRTAAHNKAISDARRSRAVYPFFKTVMCKNHPNCKYGDKCNFAHGEAELRKLDKTILDAVASSKSPGSETSSQTASDRRTEVSSTGGTSNFKTRMCKNYEKNGFCKFGDLCNFAHGRDDIQHRKRRNPTSGGDRGGAMQQPVNSRQQRDSISEHGNQKSAVTADLERKGKINTNAGEFETEFPPLGVSVSPPIGPEVSGFQLWPLRLAS
jgi:hypothetical protein